MRPVNGNERCETSVQPYEVVANAKNGFGGYTGNTNYICLLDTAERTVLELRKF